MKKNLLVESKAILKKACIMALVISVSSTMQVAAERAGSGAPDLNGVMQDKRITGVVKDNYGDGMPGVSIVVKGTTQGTTTDIDGNYVLPNVPDNATLVFSFIGMETQEISVAGKSQILVVMSESAIGLDEVVAIGYGVQRKSDVTGAVSSVKAEELTKRPITRLEQALQGTTPGVQVISSSGQPGKGLSVKIRGANSITGGNEPLYVVDGHIGGGIDALNPNDIASMEILKDASATAIYGSKGTNGVVLITTKSGEAGKTKINFNTWFSKASLPKKLDLMSASQFAETINTYYQGGAFSPDQIAELNRTGGTDWLDEITESPWTQNYDLNVSGGTEAVRYRVSFNHLRQDGMLINQYYRKSNLRVNLDIKANSRMDLKFNFSYIEPKSRNNNFQGDVYDPFSAVNIFDPTMPVYNAEGNYNLTSQWGSNGYNPVAEMHHRKDDESSKATVGTGVLTYRLFDWLTFTTNNTYSSGSMFNQSWRGPYTSEALGGVTRAEINSNTWTSFQNSNFLTFDKTFGDHRLTATLLYEQSKYQVRSQKGLSKDLSTTALTYYNLRLGGTQETHSDYSSDAMQSYMARLNYSYKDRYLLTLSLRRDGSSKLTEKYDNFPSAALAWNIARESFLEDHPVISGLKLRASYGETGNQAVGAYSTIAQVTTGNGYFFDGKNPTTTTGLGTAVSKKLVWEHAKQTDVGLDLVLWNGKFTFTADYYNKDVNDLLYNYSAPLYMGGGEYNRNMGKLNNRGFEFSIGGVPVSNKDFSWNTFLTVSFNKNKVKDLMGENDLPVNGIGTFGSQISRLVVGRPLGEFYGYEFLGTWKQNEAEEAAKYGMKPGDAKYFDKNGDHAYTPDDRVVIGNGTPDVTFGFINDFRYKDFTLSFMFQGMAGNDIYSQTLGTMWGGHGMARNATIKDALKVWTAEKETDVPVLGGTSANFFNSSRFVYNGSFVKLKNLSLAYNVPRKLLTQAYIENLEIYVSGQNLFTISDYPGYDPEVNSATDARNQGVEMGVIPNPRTYTIGLRIGF